MVALLVVLGFCSLAQAENLKLMLVPVSQFERIDVLEHVDFAGRQVMIGDKMYSMSSTMKWHGIKPGQAPRDALLQLLNRDVGYTLGEEDGITKVTAIWVLPRNDGQR
jgi:hypothetical protein